jgi:hypothetical protein
LSFLDCGAAFQPTLSVMKASEMLEAGDLDGKNMWVWIVKAIEELLLEDGPDGAKVHYSGVNV